MCSEEKKKGGKYKVFINDSYCEKNGLGFDYSGFSNLSKKFSNSGLCTFVFFEKYFEIYITEGLEVYRKIML